MCLVESTFVLVVLAQKQETAIEHRMLQESLQSCSLKCTQIQ